VASDAILIQDGPNVAAELNFILRRMMKWKTQHCPSRRHGNNNDRKGRGYSKNRKRRYRLVNISSENLGHCSSR
jgi:hypothetical protein